MQIKRTPKFDFENLFIFEKANNHQGSVDHGKRIIREFAKVAKNADVRAAIKLQFRELDTFIHPAHKGSKENKHIPRFESTRLSEEQFAELVFGIKFNPMRFKIRVWTQSRRISNWDLPLTNGPMGTALQC